MSALPASFSASLSTTTVAYVVTDGEDIVSGGYPLPATWPTAEGAREKMAGMCWHPRRFAGPFRVEAVEVETSRWGTTLAVRRIQ